MPGRHFLQIPGPTNVPERVRLAMDRSVPDHRGPDLPALTLECVDGLKQVFETRSGEIVLYPGSGTAAWEAAIVNSLEPGEKVLVFNHGHFSHLFAECARQMGIVVDELDADWRAGVQADVLEARLRADVHQEYRAVLAVHNETSTGATTDIGAVRSAMNAAGHPALLLVDSVSGLGSMEFHFDRWDVDVALTGAQKGLMLPPGMGMLCVGPRALARSYEVSSRRFFLDWRPVIEQSRAGYFPYTPATLHLFGLREALRMLFEEGLDAVYARHARLAESVRRAVIAWGFEILCRIPSERSNSLTAVMLPAGFDGDLVLRASASHDLALGTGLGRLKRRVFRIGHLGALNELEVIATLGGVELALHRAGLPVPFGSGVAAAEEFLAGAVPAAVAN